MLALATFFPTADNVGEEGFDVFGVRAIRSFSFDIKHYRFVRVAMPQHVPIYSTRFIL